MRRQQSQAPRRAEKLLRVAPRDPATMSLSGSDGHQGRRCGGVAPRRPPARASHPRRSITPERHAPFLWLPARAGAGRQQPIHWRRPQVIVPQSLPKPMHEDDLIQWFRVIDRLRDRTMFLLMVRCGLRVGEVSALTWPRINFKAGLFASTTAKARPIGWSTSP